MMSSNENGKRPDSLKDDGQLAGRGALVVGGTNGIGAAIVRRLANEGACVAFVGRDREAADSLIEKAADRRRLRFIRCDISAPENIESAVTAANDFLPRIDVLVNSAGGSKLQPFLETDLETLDRMLTINLRSTFLFSQLVAKGMINGGGSIINISSISGQRGSTLRSAYGLAKSGVIQLTRVMAVELAPYSIRVNAVAPGPIETRAVSERHRSSTRAAYEAVIPMKRYGTPEEVSGAALYLACDGASYITGHVLNVDGGFLAAGLNESL